MRKKQYIIDAAKKDNNIKSSAELVIEILLDIRDLIYKQNETLRRNQAQKSIKPTRPKWRNDDVS